MFIQTEQTPNPETIKFLPGCQVMAQGNIEFNAPDAVAGRSPLAEHLFGVDGVKSLFFGEDFISVTKQSDFDWSLVKAPVMAAIMDHFTKGLPVMADEDGTQNADTMTTDNANAILDDDDDIVKQIKELLNDRVRPAVAQDGGDIVFDRFDEQGGVVYLHMRGACAGCPSSTMTLKAGIENLLKHYVPEVREVRPSEEF